MHRASGSVVLCREASKHWLLVTAEFKKEVGGPPPGCGVVGWREAAPKVDLVLLHQRVAVNPLSCASYPFSCAPEKKTGNYMK